MSRSPSPSIRFALVLLALASFTACETRHTPPPERASAGGEVASSANADTANGADTSSRAAARDTTAQRAGDTTTSVTPAAVTTARAFGMFDNANSAEITAAGIALEKASSSAVKKFAAQMVQNHRELLHESRTLSTQLDVTPQATSDSTLMQLERQMLDALRTAPSGPSFDSLYIATQVKMHQKALAAVRTAAQSTTDAQLHKLLAHAVDVLESHMREAQRLQRGLSA